MKSLLRPLALSAALLTLLALALPEAHGMAARRKNAQDSEQVVKPIATPEPASAKSDSSETAKAPTQNAQVVVLAYHRFVDKVRRPDTEITVPEFEEQMQGLKDAGITVITMDDFLAWKRGDKQIPEKSALITFDDGWRSQYTKAWPILKKFDYPFTLFIYTDYVKGGPRAGGESMSWQDLEEFRDAGVAIESHTVSHADLRGKRAERGTPEYHEWLKKELAGSREMLEQRLGIKVRALAVPYGFYNQTVQDAAEKAGYEALFTVQGQTIDSGTPSNAIGRYILHHQKPQLFQAALKAVGGSSGGGGSAPSAVAEISNLGLAPANGSTTKELRPIIKANVAPLGKIDAESLTMRLSSLGLVQGTYDPKAHTFTHQPKSDLPPGRYSVIISATSNGQRKEGRWDFEIAGAPAKKAESTAEEPAAEKAVNEGTELKSNEETIDGDTP